MKIKKILCTEVITDSNNKCTESFKFPADNLQKFVDDVKFHFQTTDDTTHKPYKNINWDEFRDVNAKSLFERAKVIEIN